MVEEEVLDGEHLLVFAFCRLEIALKNQDKNKNKKLRNWEQAESKENFCTPYSTLDRSKSGNIGARYSVTLIFASIY